MLDVHQKLSTAAFHIYIFGHGLGSGQWFLTSAFLSYLGS